MKLEKADIELGVVMMQEFLKKHKVTFAGLVEIITVEKRYANSPTMAALWYLADFSGWTSEMSRKYGRELSDKHLETGLKQIQKSLK